VVTLAAVLAAIAVAAVVAVVVAIAVVVVATEAKGPPLPLTQTGPPGLPGTTCGAAQESASAWSAPP
jgi:hypothetical protein